MWMVAWTPMMTLAWPCKCHHIAFTLSIDDVEKPWRISKTDQCA
jgi:hypothetical protein